MKLDSDFSQPPSTAKLDELLAAAAAKRDKVYDHEKLRQYRGLASFRELDNIKPMHIAQIPDIINRASNGMLVRFKDNTAGAQLLQQTLDPSSLYNRAVTTALDYPSSPETKLTFSSLNAQAEQLTQSFTTVPSSELQPWWGRVNLLGHAHSSALQKRIFERKVFGEDDLTAEMDQFIRSMDFLTDSAAQHILSLTRADLRWFLVFNDTIQGEELMNHHRVPIRRAKVKRRYPQDLCEAFDEAGSQGRAEWSDKVYFSFNNNVDLKWDEMESSWGWDEIGVALDQLPSMTSHDATVKVVDTIDDSLDTDLGLLNNTQISAAGLAVLLKHDIYNNLPEWVRLSDGTDSQTLVGDIDLPTKLIPGTTLKFVNQLLQQAGLEESKKLLLSVQKLVGQKNSQRVASMNDWLVLLSAFAIGGDIQARDLVEAIVSDKSFPHFKFQRVWQNQEPGNIWLNEKGEIKVTDADRQLVGAIVLHTSSYIIPAKDISTSEKKPQSHPTTSIPVKISFNLPSEKRMVSSSKPVKELSVIDQVLAQPKTGQTEPQKPDYEIDCEAGVTIEELGKKLSPADLAIVKQGLKEHQQTGKHPMEWMRGVSIDGFKMTKMRLNGESSGIRVVFTRIGKKRIVTKIGYRKESSYKNLVESF